MSGQSQFFGGPHDGLILSKEEIKRFTVQVPAFRPDGPTSLLLPTVKDLNRLINGQSTRDNTRPKYIYVRELKDGVVEFHYTTDRSRIL